MAETENIAKMAEIISKEIFSWFKWNRRSIKNRNWDCVIDAHDKKTHPSDVVYYFHHPYKNCVKYLNVDLKSYAKGSINNQSIQSALQSLSKSVHCANVSPSWKQDFMLTHEYDSEVDGLLFVYNHDGNYDSEFRSHLKGIDKKTLALQSDHLIHVFGPKDISLLVDIVNDIKSHVAEGVIINKNSYSFYYPELVRYKVTGDEKNLPAIPEVLNAPWLIIKYPIKDSFNFGFIIYYNAKGDSVEEFIYLLDYLSHNQILLGDYEIKLRFTRPCEYTSSNFDKARHYYLQAWGIDPYREQKIWRISFESITNFSTKFYETEIGMD